MITAPILINTFVGFMFPVMLLLYVRRCGSAAHYIALACFALYMATAGMGKLLPFFGHSVVGGSFYFPVALYSMTMLGYYTANVGVMRSISRALVVGTLFLAFGSLRGVIFSLFGGATTTHSFEADYALFYASVVAVFKVYLVTTLGMLMASWKLDRESYLFFPVLVEIIATTPLVLYAAHRTAVAENLDWAEIAVWTYTCRILFAAVVALALEFSQRRNVGVMVRAEGCMKCLL